MAASGSDSSSSSIIGLILLASLYNFLELHQTFRGERGLTSNGWLSLASSLLANSPNSILCRSAAPGSSRLSEMLRVLLMDKTVHDRLPLGPRYGPSIMNKEAQSP